jgi:kynurenine formamidase
VELSSEDGTYRQLMASHIEWLRGLASQRRFGAWDRIGTANLIDSAARSRARCSIDTGGSVALARTLSGDAAVPGLEMEVILNQRPNVFPGYTGTDRVVLQCHDRAITHLDALNHISVDGEWYCGWALDDPAGPSVRDLAEAELFTRAVYLDIGAVRGTAWADAPVTADDIEKAIAECEISFRPGDALLIDMGRDCFEQDGRHMVSQGSAPADYMQPGIGLSAARWVAEHDVSVVCWDFQDAINPSEPRYALHGLIWAIGQIIVDNCDFSGLRAAVRGGRASSVGAFALAALPITGATGSAVNPLVIL